jgi:2-polyprenyl-3-methyl-5-hydroxy-6-metoxy-1,4-benzoquinol methylase
MHAMKCRHCATPLHERDDLFIDLGSAPPSNAFLQADTLNRPDTYLPLKVLACPECALVQVDELQRHDALFSDDYVYFSSYSTSWLTHARDYVTRVIDRLALHSRSLVMEVASNDGYLLQYLQQRDIPCVGIEPTESTARVARSRGIESIGEFFGLEFARRFVAQRGRCDLVLGNNVLAHVPDINDFVAGLREVLAPMGTLTLEFPHLLQLVQQTQFDTIYHEHFSYLGLHTVQRILRVQGLVLFDVEELLTHGGSLRVWVQHAANPRPALASVATLLAREAAAGMGRREFHAGLQAGAERIKDDLLLFLIDCKRRGLSVAGYGAAAKGNTLLNFAGVRPDLLPYVADASPHKQGRFLPGTRIPVLAPQQLLRDRPDVVLILPWNLREEIVAQWQAVRGWGGRFATVVPELRID